MRATSHSSRGVSPRGSRGFAPGREHAHHAAMFARSLACALLLATLLPACQGDPPQGSTENGGAGGVGAAGAAGGAGAGASGGAGGAGAGASGGAGGGT